MSYVTFLKSTYSIIIKKNIMDVTLQRHCARYIYVIPEGLKELMSDITREVLRSQPQDIYLFIADYLDALMITRENARVAARLVKNITDMAEVTVELLQETGIEQNQAYRVVEAIQQTLLNFLGTSDKETADTISTEEEQQIVDNIIQGTGITSKHAYDAAVIIQKSFRDFKFRKEQVVCVEKIDWREAARSTMRLYRKTDVTNEEANRAATLIKAAYKGYYTRRYLKKMAEEQNKMAQDHDRYVEETMSGIINVKHILSDILGTVVPISPTVSHGEDAIQLQKVKREIDFETEQLIDVTTIHSDFKSETVSNGIKQEIAGDEKDETEITKSEIDEDVEITKSEVDENVEITKSEDTARIIEEQMEGGEEIPTQPDLYIENILIGEEEYDITDDEIGRHLKQIDDETQEDEEN